MFYLIYLFSSLILICNNTVNCNEDVQKVVWACASENCDKPISEIKTTSPYKVKDHIEKLTFEAGVFGTLLKKPTDNSNYVYAEINGQRGYVNKDFVREGKVLSKPEFKVDGVSPFSSVSHSGTSKIIPSQPTVIDGTTLYDNDMSESDNTKSLPSPPNMQENTPPLKNADVPPTVTGDVQIDNNRSTPADSVELASPGVPIGAINKPESEDNLLKEDKTSDSVDNPSENLINSKEDNSARGTPDSGEVRELGIGSATPDESFDEDYDGRVEVEEGDVDELPSKLLSTIENQSERADSNFKKDSLPPTETKPTPGILSDKNSSLTADEPLLPSNENLQGEKVHLESESASTVPPHTEIPSNHSPSMIPHSRFIYGRSNTASERINENNIKPLDPLQNTSEEFQKESGVEEKIPSEINNLFPNDSNNLPVDSLQLDPVNTDPLDYKPTLFGVNVSNNISEPLTSTPPTYPSSSDEQELNNQNNSAESLVENSSVQPSVVMSEHPNTVTSEQPNEVTSERPLPEKLNDVESTPLEISDESTIQASKDSDTNANYSQDLNSENSYGQNISSEPFAEIDSEVRPNLSEISTDDSYVNVKRDQEDGLYTTSSPDDSLKIDDTQDSVENAQQDIKETEEFPPTNEPNQESSLGFYSSISSFFDSFKEMFVKSELPSDDRIDAVPAGDGEAVTEDSQPSVSPSAPSGYCYEGNSCGGLERPIGGEDQQSSYWTQYPSVDVFRNPAPLSVNSLIYICITSVVVLLFSLGYYYIDKCQSSSCLIEKINTISQELFVTKKERDTLEDQLLKIKENCNIMDSSKLKQDSKVSSLQKALADSEAKNVQLEETVQELKKEVETLMEKGLEMHKLLSDTISEEDLSQVLLANIEELKESLSEKLNEIVALTNQLDKKNEEIQLMQIDLRNANDRINELERKLELCKSETEGMYTKKQQDYQQQIIKLQQVLEEKGVSVAKLENELAKTKVERDAAEARATSAEAGLQAAHSVGAGVARQVWMESTSVRAELAISNKANESLEKTITEINNTNKTLQDKISLLNEEISNLNSKYENVEKEKVNALTKLQVLSDYFKEKESKLQEELGMKESLWLQKESEDHTIYEQMKSLREEIASYKAQNDKLKSEILEQEASYKVQIANEEQKSYDNWVALRQAERKVKELQMESAHFRNRLTQIETANQSTTEALNPNSLEKSSFGAPSPPFMMLPPLGTEFFSSLPPPPIHPSASRPPPLGRISSPQLSGEMLPPPPIVPFDMYLPPPSSTPPPPPPLYKPQPRTRAPPPKDSPPSNYSSESVNDKPHRRRRR